MPRFVRRRVRVLENGSPSLVASDSSSRAPGNMTMLGRRPTRMPGEVLSRNPPHSLTGNVYRAHVSDVLLDRYYVRAGLGYGSFGTVVEAEDIVTGTVVAIKLLHRDEDPLADIHREQRTYSRLVEGCDPRVNLFAQVMGSGTHNGFHCIIFEICHASLEDVIRGFDGLAPLPARHVLEMSFQMLCAVSYLHSLGIIHTDLKPDNIAVKYSDTTIVQWLDPFTGFHNKKILVTPHICIIDLGSVENARAPRGNLGRVGTTQYRAPEVTLGLPWSFGVDAFALGCVIAEIYLSSNLMSAKVESDREQLATINVLFGPFPVDYARGLEALSPGMFTFNDTAIAVRYPPGNEPISDPDSIADPDHAEALRRLELVQPISSQMHNATLCDLIRSLTRLDPTQRLTPDAASKHQYFDALRTLQLG